MYISLQFVGCIKSWFCFKLKEELSAIKIPSKSFSPLMVYLEILYLIASIFSSTINQAPLPIPGNHVPLDKLNFLVSGNSVPIKLGSYASNLVKKAALYSLKWICSNILLLFDFSHFWFCPNFLRYSVPLSNFFFPVPIWRLSDCGARSENVYLGSYFLPIFQNGPFFSHNFILPLQKIFSVPSPPLICSRNFRSLHRVNKDTVDPLLSWYSYLFQPRHHLQFSRDEYDANELHKHLVS